ncbi:stem cell self-renewal protein Piwi, partial [Linderina pennispora]
HSTRFFPISHDGDRSGNCMPGMCIDHSVTLPGMANFYLYLHAALRGTSRPTHHYVLHDDALFSQDHLQQPTYHLCYTYTLCTRSALLAPPGLLCTSCS